jgi:hypothetical protein
MPVEILDADSALAQWDAISEILGPTLKYDPAGMTLEELRKGVEGKVFHIVGGDVDGARGYLAFHFFDEDGERCCFASYFSGQIEGGPRQMVSTMRHLMSCFEVSCRAAGVMQMFIGGRDWSRVFPDYEEVDGVRNRRRKRL